MCGLVEKKIYHPAARQRGADKIHGVCIHGLGAFGDCEPMLIVSVFDVVMVVV